jgi:hypothetical protein
MNETPPALEERPAPNRFVRMAAVSSLATSPAIIAILVFFYFYLFSHGHTRMLVLALVPLFALAIIVLGLCLGIVALVLLKGSQRRGLFASALVGVCLNGLLLILLIGSVLVPLIVYGHKYPVTAQDRLQAAIQKLTRASSDEEKFYALDSAAKESFNAGNIQDAGKYANELLKLAPEFKGNWNYGNAIQDGNLVLGRIALHEGRTQEARQYLLAAGGSPGSPTMDSFGPNMSLAKDLLEKGQRDVVLQYFELCRKFWSMDYGKLDEWSNEVKAGKIPDFGANLVY